MTDFSTVGDYARQLILRRQNADARAQVDALVSEVGTGRKRDLAGEVRGQFMTLAALDADLTSLSAYRDSALELRGRADAMQRVLDTLGTTARETGAQFLAPLPAGEGVEQALGEDARDRFTMVVDQLNSSLAGRALFAGVAVDGPALANSEDMLSALETAVAGLPDAASVETAVRTWFAPGGDFETVGYLGATEVPRPQTIGAGRSATLAVTASEPSVRELLAGLAMAALSVRPPISGNAAERRELFQIAGITLMNAETEILGTRTKIGVVESAIDRADVATTAEETALRSARSDLTDVDIYEAATKLEAAQGQLELLYAITARNSRLSLVRALS
jgi:flagellar hook-associated protein 3 FlgL